MSLTALDYPITDPFGDTSEPYSPSHPHAGNDFGALMGTPVVVAGTQIGLSGNSGSYQGMTYAPHLHVQAGRDEWAQKPINSLPYVGKPGTVAKVGFASEWGNYICIKVDDVYVYYCHLSRQDVAVGTVIREEDLVIPSRDDVIARFKAYAEAAPSEEQINYYTQRDIRALDNDMLVSCGAIRDGLRAELHPTVDQVKAAFSRFGSAAPTADQTAYYVQRSWDALYGDLLNNVAAKLEAAQAQASAAAAGFTPLAETVYIKK